MARVGLGLSLSIRQALVLVSIAAAGALLVVVAASYAAITGGQVAARLADMRQGSLANPDYA